MTNKRINEHIHPKKKPNRFIIHTNHEIKIVES